jgi:hypothetical protein
MKAIRVSKLNDTLRDINPNTKIWFSFESPNSINLADVPTAELEMELSKRTRKIAEDLFHICASELHELGFDIHDFM